MRRLRRLLPPLLLTALAATWACGVLPGEPEQPPLLTFSTPELHLGTARAGSVDVRNAGGLAAGPVVLTLDAVRSADGAAVPGATVRLDPGEVPTLNPGDARRVQISVVLGTTVGPGTYDASLHASAPGAEAARAILRFTVPESDTAAASLSIRAPATTARTGDVLPLEVEVRGTDGALVEGAMVVWSVAPAGTGFVSGHDEFVAYTAGLVTLVARVGEAADTVTLEVTDRGLRGSFGQVGAGVETERFTSDLWLHGAHAYLGSWATRQGSGGTINPGNQLTTWSIADPSSPTRVSVLEVDARTVNDVKIRSDGRLGVITHEGSADGLNGVTFLDLADPGKPAPVGRYTQGLESGVHNAWLEGAYAYLVVDGVGSGLRILDVSDPAAPRLVASYYAGASFLHDVHVRDGLAFLSHWDAGLVILDVGHGVAGGSPEAPREVARVELDGETHNAWYWPEAGYVFVGEEDFGTPGVMHVVDVADLRRPREVATFAVAGQTPHNFWLDEASQVLYMAWYGQGLRALDVSGRLLGELDRQGREIAWIRYGGGTGACNLPSPDTCAWAPQLHAGHLWVADMNRGLVALLPPR